KLNNVFPGFRFKKSSNDIFFPFQVWLNVGIFEINLFLPLQKQQSHICSTQVAGTTNNIPSFGRTSFYIFIRRNLTYSSNRNYKAFFGSGSIATYQVHAVSLTSSIHPFI